MVCNVHKESNATSTCSKCGEWICDDCKIEKNGVIICKACDSKHNEVKGTSILHYHCTEKQHSSTLLILLSFLPPGINYMYLGLINIGMVTLASFIGLIMLSTILPNVALLIPVLWIYNFFDGLKKSKFILAGGKIEDNIEPIKRSIIKNKAYIIGVSVFIIFIGIANSTKNIIRKLTYDAVREDIYNVLIELLVPLIIIIGVTILASILFKKNNKNNVSSKEIDKNNEN